MKETKRDAKSATKKGIQTRTVNHPVGTVINQATAIVTVLKRKTEDEVKVREETESHQTREKEINQKRGRTPHTLEIRKITKAIKTIVFVMIVHMIPNLKMTEPVIQDPGQTLNQKQKMKHLPKEKNLKEKITEEDTIKTTE